jgi:hypothetical protein
MDNETLLSEYGTDASMVDYRPFVYAKSRLASAACSLSSSSRGASNGLMDKRIRIVVEGHRMLLLVLRRQGTHTMSMAESDTP